MSLRRFCNKCGLEIVAGNTYYSIVGPNNSDDLCQSDWDSAAMDYITQVMSNSGGANIFIAKKIN